MSATFRICSAPPEAWLRIEGELDVPSRGPLLWRLLDLEESGCTTLHLDVGQVTHVDARSMSLIEEARSRVRARSGHFHITAASSCFGLVARAAGFTTIAEQAERADLDPGRPPLLTPLPGGGDRPQQRAG